MGAQDARGPRRGREERHGSAAFPNGAAIAAVATPASSTCYTAAYTWDARNRPTGVTYGDVPAATPAPLAAVTFGHGYNAVNQRVSQTVSDNSWIAYPSGPTTATGYTANSLNQYSCVGVTAPSCTGVVPTYDGNGNLTSDGTYTLGYDAENRLTSASASGLTAAYAYDARGRRKAKTVNGTTTVYVTDADNREVLEYDGSTGAVLRWYAYGMGPNDVLAQTTPGVTPTRVTFIPDLQGSIIGSVSMAGTVTSFAYRPYGGGTAPASQFAYTAQRIDPETGFYYYRARMYSPAWGRFFQADSAGYSAGTNLYVYVGNDPLNAIDPNGLWQITITARYYIGLNISVGKNSGQWSLGAWFGGAAGNSVRINVFDSGPATPGYDYSACGQAAVFAYGQQLGSFGLQHSFTTGIDTLTASALIGPGYNATVQVQSPGGWDFNVRGPFATWGTGASAFLGVGGMWTSTPDANSVAQAASPTALQPAPVQGALESTSPEGSTVDLNGQNSAGPSTSSPK